MNSTSYICKRPPVLAGNNNIIIFRIIFFPYHIVNARYKSQRLFYFTIIGNFRFCAFLKILALDIIPIILIEQDIALIDESFRNHAIFHHIENSTKKARIVGIKEFLHCVLFITPFVILGQVSSVSLTMQQDG